MESWLVAVLVGLVQGVLEWLPVSSEGSVALVLTLLGDTTPEAAIEYGLFVHAGTAVAATAYYRDELRRVGSKTTSLRPASPFAPETADVWFFGVATVVSGVVGIAAYAILQEVASALAGGAFVALIGVLLVLTGVVQRVAEGRGSPRTDGSGGATQRDSGGATAAAVRQDSRTEPSPLDAVLVGVLQGLAILPGVSRSGTTVSALLLRGHGGVESLRLSFVLSIPAAIGAGALTLATDGLPGITAGNAVLMLVVSAVVGYLTVGALVALVRRVAFWAVCVGFGALAVAGGLLLL